MATYTQTNRPLSVTTPLGKDVLLLIGIQGREAISQLFELQLDLLAKTDADVAFDRIVGQSVTVSMPLPEGGTRYFNGIIRRFEQGGRNEDFGRFRAELVPEFWLWMKKVQSRIFQHLTIPDILKQVLNGLSVDWDRSLKQGQFRSFGEGHLKPFLLRLLRRAFLKPSCSSSPSLRR